MSGTIWTKFYWADWQSEPALRLCSYAARGLWMDMLCIAAAHDPIGYVAVAGRALDETDIARMTGGSESEVRALLGELDRNGVFSRDRQSRIFSRRMVADAKKAAIARKNGRTGGNPKLRNSEGNSPSDNPPDKGGLKPQEPRAKSQEPDGSSFELPLSADEPAKPKSSRRKPEVAIPDGFPDQRALLDAQVKLRTEGVDLDALAQAERFRNHAQQTDRRCRDWSAAWRNWIASAIDRVPKKPQTAAVAQIDPLAVWRQRLAKFLETRFWREQWGAQPVRTGPQPPGVQVPPEILAEFGFPTSPSRSAA